VTAGAAAACTVSGMNAGKLPPTRTLRYAALAVLPRFR
jgi:hypothetical protein